MADVSNYQSSENLVRNWSGQVNSPELAMAAAQAEALRAVVDALNALREQVQRVAAAVESIAYR